MRRNSAARKKAKGVYVDLSALAKGLGVDELAEHMAAKSCTDFMVDIGGEMRTVGSSLEVGLGALASKNPSLAALAPYIACLA